ncbi:MAG: hypothetical protein CVT94_17030 [Bacteroidetes bacterium HGW-Bacteroidetes-11]|jgi:DNA-binding NarL/FixJ family response regulator|nr:MAG: hypothetical protein CVT94_17030 [Bacteroidetes bacterium HGW-Bacteroidetes-11]
MSQLKILVLSLSNIIRLGIQQSLSDLNIGAKVYLSSEIDSAKDIIEKLKISLIIVDENIASANEFEKLTTNPDLKILYLSFRSADIFEKMHININQKELGEKLREYINPGKDIKNQEGEKGLSKRENEVVRMLSLGAGNKEIAQKLHLSLHTVLTHRKNIIRKLGIKTTSGITVYAILNGIITIEEATI